MDDNDAFRALYEGNVQAVRRVVHRMCPLEDLEDLVQEVFVKVFENQASFQARSQIKTWIYSVAINTARDHLRKRKRKSWLSYFEPSAPLYAEASAPDARDALTDTDDQGRRARLRKQVDLLSPKLKEVVVLHSLEEIDVKDVAVILGLPEGTVKSRLNKAREKLHVALSEVDDDSRD